MCTIVIAIDGPAASGKSTVGREVAEQLGFFYFDTGLLYRAVTWKALQVGVPVDDERALVDLIATSRLEVGPPTVNDGRLTDVRVDGVDVSHAVREPRVDQHVSRVAAHPAVRAALIEAQREVGGRRPTVMAGRDIGTVIFPEARLKVFLTASLRERARRRLAERCQPTDASSLRRACVEMAARDEQDSSRQAAPLRQAADAVALDTDHLTVEQVVQRVVDLARARCLPRPE
jgi:cytidylate kinase